MYNRYDFFIISGCRNGIQCITTNIFHNSFLDWLWHLDYRGIRVFKDDILKSHAMLCLDISKIEKPSGTLDSKLTDDGLFYVDNVGEEEKASEKDKQSKLINDTFVEVAQIVKSSDNESRKRKGKSNGKKVKFIKYELHQNSVPVKDGTSASSESEVEDPSSDS